MPDFTKPPEGALEVLTDASNVIIEATGGDTVYLYGSAGRYYKGILDPGTRTVGKDKRIEPGRRFSATSDFDIGIQSTDPRDTLDILNELIAEGKVPRFIPRTEMPKGYIVQIQNKGYWPSGHIVSYIIHDGPLHGRVKDQYVFGDTEEYRV